MIFCDHCGYAMFGQTNAREDKRRYYRHCHASRSKPCPGPKTWLRADEIEELVMLQLFNVFGNADAVKKAVEDAIPNKEQVKRDRERIERIDEELKKIANGRDRIIGMVMDDAISDAEARKRLAKSKDREQQLKAEYHRLTEALSGRQTAEQVSSVAKTLQARFASAKPLSQLTYEEKRSLCEMVFSGNRLDGRRMGIYVTWGGRKN